MKPAGSASWKARVSWPLVRDISMGVLAVLVVVLGVQAIRHVGGEEVPSGGGVGLPSPTGDAPAVLFVGDNYTAAGAGITNTYARQTAKTMGWVYLLDAQAGTGFVAAGQQRSSANGPYFSRLDRVKSVFRPDYVIVTGGRNDAGENSTRVVQAATSYLHAVRKAFPDARMIIVAPFWVDSRPPSTLLALRNAERGLAPALHAAFIDPLSQGWITNQNQSQYIGGDRVDPTVEGHAYLARLLTAEVKRIAWPTARSTSATRSTNS